MNLQNEIYLRLIRRVESQRVQIKFFWKRKSLRTALEHKFMGQRHTCCSVRGDVLGGQRVVRVSSDSKVL